jgi:hypothetical protein
MFINKSRSALILDGLTLRDYKQNRPLDGKPMPGRAKDVAYSTIKGERRATQTVERELEFRADT